MAGPLDFTGQNIEDTYQRVLQTDGTLVYDGTGSLVSLQFSGSFSGSYVGDGSGLTGISATAAPAGPNQSVQFRDGSATSGSSNFTFDKTINSVRLTGSLLLTQSHISTIDYVDFTTNIDQPTALGRLGWNDSDGTLSLGLKGGNLDLLIGEAEVAYVYNAEGTPLTKGEVVYISGSQGNRIAVKRASNSSEGGSAGTLGFVAETIVNGETGFVITSGVLRKVDTSAYEAGKLVYLSDTPGQYTQTRPIAPQHEVRLGYVERVDNIVGSIYVKVDNGYEIDELHNVLDTTTNESYGDLFVRSGSLWISSRQLTGSYGITGSLTATSLTSSLFGTSSWAYSSSQAVSSSYALTASYLLGAVTFNTSSLLITASATNNAIEFKKGDNSAFTITIDTGSQPDLTALNNFTSSIQSQVDAIVVPDITPLNNFSGSILTFTSSIQSQVNDLTSVTSSYLTQETDPIFVSVSASLATTGSNTFKSDQVITGSLTITNNLTVLGSSSVQHITSSQLNIGTNIITVSTNTPSVRFGGLAVIDSGSSPQTSGSILFDSQNNQWIFVHSNTAGQVTSSVFIQGPQTFNNIGNETTLTTNRLAKAYAGDLGEHIGDSNISDDGTRITMTGSVIVTGSLQVTGSVSSTGGFTGSLLGTASWAATSSHSTTASYFENQNHKIYRQDNNTLAVNANKVLTILANNATIANFGATVDLLQLVSAKGVRPYTTPNDANISIDELGSSVDAWNRLYVGTQGVWFVSSSTSASIEFNGSQIVFTGSVLLPTGTSASFSTTSSFAVTASYIDPTFISASAAASGFGSGGGSSFSSTSSIIGDGTNSSYDINHGFNTRNLHITVYENFGSYETVYPDIRRTNLDTASIVFANPVSATKQYVVYVSQ